MAEYVITLRIEDAFYQEFHEQGAVKDELLRQLKLDIQDQLDEYDLPRLLTCMVSSENHENVLVLTPKKRESEQFPQFLLVSHGA